jgi:hypothetical protein
VPTRSLRRAAASVLIGAAGVLILLVFGATVGTTCIAVVMAVAALRLTRPAVRGTSRQAFVSP